MQPIMMSNAHDIYRKQGVMTASPVELIVMLYDGLKKNLLLAQKKMKNGDSIEATHKHLIRAQDIVSELISSLDMNIEMSENLLSLYEFILYSIGEVNLKKDPELLDPLIVIVQQLKEAWEEISSTNKGSIALTED